MFLTRIKEHTQVGPGGLISIRSPQFPEGAAVEVIVIFETPPTQDTTEYLLSTEANRRHLREAIEQVETRDDVVVMTPEEWHEKYCL